MSQRREARLRAAALAAACLSGGLALIAAAFGLLNLEMAGSLGTTAFHPTYTPTLIVTLVGLLIAWRHPAHLVAWTFLATGLSAEMLSVFWSYGFYGTVTDLAATYIAAVVLLQALLRPVTGGSEVAIALSTLLVVALFQPIRRRAQDAVDRRFYRARYDAARTIDAFSARLRGDVELDSVRADLIAVIHETIHPAHASVWLRRPR